MGGDEALSGAKEQTAYLRACFLSGASKTFSAFQSLAGPGSEVRHLHVGLGACSKGADWLEMGLLVLSGSGPITGTCQPIRDRRCDKFRAYVGLKTGIVQLRNTFRANESFYARFWLNRE